MALSQCRSRHFGFLRSEHLRLELHFLVDDLLDDADQDVSHHELTVEVALKLRKQDPLEAKVDSFAAEELLQALHVVDRVRVLQRVCDLLNLLHENLFNRELIAMVDHRVLQFERAAAVLGHHECVAADVAVFALQVVHRAELVSVVVVSHVLAQDRVLLVLRPSRCQAVTSLLQGHLAHREKQGALACLEQACEGELLFPCQKQLLGSLVGQALAVDDACLPAAEDCLWVASRQHEEVEAVLGEAPRGECFVELGRLVEVFFFEVRLVHHALSSVQTRSKHSDRRLVTHLVPLHPLL